MRKITETAIDALYSRRAFSSTNTVVARASSIANLPEELDQDTTWVLYLHNNAIVALAADGSVWITDGGWETLTTKERLNGVPGVRVWHHRRELHLSAPEHPSSSWDGSWTLATRSGPRA